MGSDVTAGRLGPETADELDLLLAGADLDLLAGYPGDRGTRAPVHTLYLPADRAVPDLLATVRDEALAAADDHAGDAATMARVTGLPPELVEQVWPGVLDRLAQQPVDDLRLDLEDGYGVRPEKDEDAHAVAAGELLATVGAHGGPFVHGVRVKSLEAPTRRRGIRSLDLVLTAAGGAPPGFVVTAPKVTSVAQVRALVRLCERLEQAHDLAAGALRFELQVETPQAVLGPDGTATVAAMVHAAAGRCGSLHYGTYDYSAALGVPAAQQAMDHPVADHATSVMQLAAAGTGVRVSHGSTNVLPVGGTEEVRAAWSLHARLVRRSLARGIAAGWDLHPAQLVTRHLATAAFYREGLDAAARRLQAYEGRAASGVLDEPATALALAGFLLRGVDARALDLDEVLDGTGLDEVRLRAHARRGGGLGRLQTLPLPDLRQELHDVCAARRWVDAVAAARPYRSSADLLAASDAAVGRLGEADLDQALAGHPRIGERSGAASSRREQAGVGDDTRAALGEANAAYESRFGHVYLVCASGRSGAELLDVLRERLGNDPDRERLVVLRELAAINRLRLQRLVEEP